MPGPFQESPNIAGTYKVSQDVVNQILAMGQGRALEMARANVDPEFREAVFRIYPQAAGEGLFSRPNFTPGAGAAEGGLPGGPTAPGPIGPSAAVPTPPAAPPVSPGAPSGAPPLPPMGIGAPTPPTPPPPPPGGPPTSFTDPQIPQPVVPTPPVPDQLRELFGLSPGAGGGGGGGGVPTPPLVPPRIGGSGGPVPRGVTAGPTGGVTGIAAEQGQVERPPGYSTMPGMPGSASVEDFSGPTHGAGGVTGAALEQGQTERPGTQMPGGGGRVLSGPFEGSGQTNPTLRRLQNKNLRGSGEVLPGTILPQGLGSDLVDFAGTGIGGFHSFSDPPTGRGFNEDIINTILELLGISSPRTSQGRLR